MDVVGHRAGWLRAGGWGAAGVVASVAGAGWWSATGEVGSAAGLGALAGLAVGLVAEAARIVVGQMGEGGPGRPPAGARPADGVVEVWGMAGVAAAGPGTAGRWRRFEGVEVGPERRRLSSRPVPLLGDVALVSVFVGRDGRAWTGREVAEAHKSLEAAGRWLEGEAARWGAPVNVGLAEVYFVAEDPVDEDVAVEFLPEGGDVGPWEVDATTRAVAGASRVAAALGFADVVDLLERVNPRVRADAHAWLFHLKRRGRSMAIPAGDRVIPGVGVAICYSREASFSEPLVGPGRVDPTTVAHELLHLFGATDKYGVPLDQFPPGTVGRRDVMRLDEDRLDRLRMGSLTAAEVGWDVAAARPVGDGHRRGQIADPKGRT